MLGFALGAAAVTAVKDSFTAARVGSGPCPQPSFKMPEHRYAWRSREGGSVILLGQTRTRRPQELGQVEGLSLVEGSASQDLQVDPPLVLKKHHPHGKAWQAWQSTTQAWLLGTKKASWRRQAGGMERGTWRGHLRQAVGAGLDGTQDSRACRKGLRQHAADTGISGSCGLSNHWGWQPSSALFF